MNFKIGLRNIKRNIHDYTIYVITLTISLSFVSAMSNISTSQDVLNLSDNMKNLKSATTISTILLMLIVGYLTCYVTMDLLSKRKKEFGILSLAGMKKKKISEIFLTELFIMGVISYIISIFIGAIFQKLLILGVENIFESKHLSLNLFSTYSIILSMIFLISSLLFSKILIRKKIKNADIKMMIIDNRKNRIFKKEDSKKYKIRFIISLILCIVGIKLILNVASMSDNSAYLIGSMGVAALMIGIYELAYSMSFLLVIYGEKIKIDNNKGVRTIINRQFTSKAFRNGKSVGISSILLASSLILIMLGTSIGNAYKANIETEAPFDIAVSIDYPEVNFLDILKHIGNKEAVDKFIQYKLYENKKSLKQIYNGIEENYMLLSDYNTLRNILGLDKIELQKGKYALHVEDYSEQKKIKKIIGENKIIHIDDKVLSNSNMYTEPFSQFGFNGIKYLIIVNDDLKNKLEGIKSRLVVKTKKPTRPELKGEIKRVMNKSKNIIKDYNKKDSHERVTIGVMVKSWSKANGLTGLVVLSFTSLFIGVIFVITSLTLLSLQQLIQRDKQKKSFNVVQNVGYSKNQCKTIIIKQLLLYFCLPLIVPFFVLIIITIFLQHYYGPLISQGNVFIYGAIRTILILGSIYILYFFGTYAIQKNSLLEK